MLSMMRILTAPVAAAILMLAGCSPKPADTAAQKTAEAGKRYAMKGVIKAVDPAAKTATIDAEKIGDWMDAMTMPYPVKPDSELEKLHVGDKIEAVVVVNDPAFYVTDIKVVK
jgi:Cu/Ag efflux protein CusF